MSSRPPLVAAAVTFAGLMGLALGDSTPSVEAFHAPRALAWGLTLLGLLMCVWLWQRRQREAAVQSDALVRLNGFHAVMSQTNRLILRRPDPNELFEGVCALCVEEAHLGLAIVDLLEARGAHRKAAVVRSERLADPTPGQLLDGAQLQTLLMTMALQAGRPVVVDDATTDPRLQGVRAWCDATGFSALAAVPLRRGDRLVSALLLCSRQRFVFSGAVTPLLGELGDDLSFALDNADRERERQSALLAEHARALAEDANRAKTEFLAQMSHELRTPLNAMLGFAQLLAADEVQALTPLQAERVRLIDHAGWHLLGLVNDVMDISRIESRRFEVVNIRGDISPVLDEALAMTQPLAERHRIELGARRGFRSGIGAVVDPRRLLQVLLNLLSNACKYNRPGGQVRVEVTQEDTEVILDVIDNGVGMTHEQLAHLFEPFNRLGHEGRVIEGTGIGLALARQLVEMMNGRLEIASNTESGTRARLVLPSCAIPLAAPSDDPALRTAQVAQSRATVLYIEDDPVNRILVEQMLLRFGGVQLLLAETGEDGIALARLKKPDLILLDMHLPDMTGFDVLGALRSDSRTAALQVVAVSANAISTEIAKAKALGALDYWTKPLKLQAFLSGVSALLGVATDLDGARASRDSCAT